MYKGTVLYILGTLFVSSLINYLVNLFLAHFTFWTYFTACMHAQSLQLSLTLCDHMDCSPPGSSVPGIFQARE